MNRKTYMIFLCISMLLIMIEKVIPQIIQENRERKIEERIFAERKKMFGKANAEFI